MAVDYNWKRAYSVNHKDGKIPADIIFFFVECNSHIFIKKKREKEKESNEKKESAYNAVNCKYLCIQKEVVSFNISMSFKLEFASVCLYFLII